MIRIGNRSEQNLQKLPLRLPHAPVGGLTLFWKGSLRNNKSVKARFNPKGAPEDTRFLVVDRKVTDARNHPSVHRPNAVGPTPPPGGRIAGERLRQSGVPEPGR